MLQRRPLWFALVLSCLTFAHAADTSDARTKGWFGFDAKAEIQGAPSQDPVLASLQVESVAPASPAAMAGLAAGDLIVAVQGTQVSGTHATALRSLMQKVAGETIQLTIKHGTEAPKAVTLTAMPKPGGA
ncbi:MAG: PDZ domain-containing protein [Burkholderiales bacterium]|nr:PDZ domain-containing protein [Burkholderiales bacterium]